MARGQRQPGWPGTVETTRKALAIGWVSGRWIYVLSLVLSGSAGVLPALAATLTAKVVDRLAEPIPGAAGTPILAGCAAAIGGAAALLNYLLGYLTAKVEMLARIHVTEQLFTALNQVEGMGSLEQPELHEHVTIADAAAATAPMSLTGFSVSLLTRSTSLVAVTAAAFRLQALIAALLLGSVVPAVALQVLQVRSQVEAIESQVAHQRGHDYYKRLFTDLRSARETKTLDAGALFLRRMTAALRTATQAELAAQKKVSVTQSVFAALNLAILAFGSVLIVTGISHGRGTGGDLVYFLAAAGLMQTALVGMAYEGSEAVRALALFKHFLYVVALPLSQPNGNRPTRPLYDAIEFRDVWFRYQDDGSWALRGVNLIMPAGSSLGIVGLNGAGKSTLIKLLLRLYRPTRGRILWDGVDIDQFDVASYRQQISVCFQDFVAFELDAVENICISEPTRLRDLALAGEAATTASIHHELMTLPHGYETVLTPSRASSSGDRGTALSGGQWQRVAIARTVAKRSASVMLLDEPNAGLDPLTDHAVQERLRTNHNNRTLICISHRLSSLRYTDQIFVLSAGQVVETGPHQTLLSQEGVYASLYATQARAYQP